MVCEGDRILCGDGILFKMTVFHLMLTVFLFGGGVFALDFDLNKALSFAILSYLKLSYGLSKSLLS